jgi:hypothetical protein
MRKNKLSGVELCSRCAVTEIAGWVYENQLRLEPDTIREIREELKDIRLRDGECVVCKRDKVVDNCFSKILGIMQRDKKIERGVIDEFKKFSGMMIEI